MAKYSGFTVQTKPVLVLEDQSSYAACYFVNFENRGDTPVNIIIDEVPFRLETFDSMTLPFGGNQNPLVQIAQDYKVQFEDETDRRLIVTKAYTQSTTFDL
jgi:hypothetical protein